MLAYGAMPAATLPAALGPILDFVDMAGIFVFALSGALLAAVKRQTVVTFFFFAVVTGVDAGHTRVRLTGTGYADSEAGRLLFGFFLSLIHI